MEGEAHMPNIAKTIHKKHIMYYLSSGVLSIMKSYTLHFVLNNRSLYKTLTELIN